LIFKLSRTVYSYSPKLPDDGPLIDALVGLADQYPRYGFGKLFRLIRRQGHTWNHKRVYRLYCALKLNLRRKGKKRLPSRHPEKLSVPAAANVCWSADFMSDVLMNGQRFRTLNVLDDFNREALAIEVDTTLPAARVVRVLERIAAWRGYPAKLRLDNGPELVSVAMAEWAEENGVVLEFIQPGKPTQNSYIERFNRTYREEVLDFYVFSRLSEVRDITDRWLKEYNEQRPHEALGHLTPAEFLAVNAPEVSTIDWH
jgi:putative transposase